MVNKRRGGGGGRKSPKPSLEKTLRQEVESTLLNTNYTRADDIADHLYSTGRFRQKKTPFKWAIQQALDKINTRRTSPIQKPFYIDDSDVADSPVRKRRKEDSAEAKLIRIEQKHNERRVGVGSVSSSGSESVSSETDDSDSDAVFEEGIEPVFDVTKDMLTASYMKSVPKLGKNGKLSTGKKVVLADSTDGTDDDTVFDSNTSKKMSKKMSKKVSKGEKNVELEVVNSGKTRKRSDLSRENEKGTSEEVKETDGPRFKDLGGMSAIVEGLKSEVLFPLLNPQLLKRIGVNPIKGILLKGPPGCGKTKLAHAIANETGKAFYKIAATELVSGVSGASEENIRELFEKANRTAPSIVFIDEIDVIGSKRENQQREMEKRIVTQLMTCMDDSHKAVQSSDYVLVIGATNRPDALDPALRRPGRFDREITLSVPDEKGRVEILSVLVTNLKIENEGSFDLVKIARSTPGFVGADLAALVNKAGNLAMKRIIDRRKSELSKEPLNGDCAEDWWRRSLSIKEMETLSITMADFEEAATLVQPSSRREGFSSIPNVKWEDVGGLPELREDFVRYIVKPIKNPDKYANVDLDFGFLLYGPPGCGKTLIAKAVANEAGANFIHIKGPELLNKYVGESELAIRTLFSRARTCAPCILFFDEVDALTANGDTEGGGVVNRLLRQLMIELSGSDERRNVFLIGATNRPEVMDRALFRNQRFGKLMHVTLPNADERGSILTALARRKKIDADVDLIAIGRDEACKNLSGADLSALMNEAAMLAAESSSSDSASWSIKKEHFEVAQKKISPSVSEEQEQHYYLFEQSLKAA